MKIAFIRYPAVFYDNDKVIKGGSEIANQYLIDYLLTQGVDVVEFSPENKKRLELINIPAVGTPLVFQDLFKKVDEINKCDLVVTTNWFGFIMPEIKIPIITIFHHNAQLVLGSNQNLLRKDELVFKKWLKKIKKYGLGKKTSQRIHDNVISIEEKYQLHNSKISVAVSDYLKKSLIKSYSVPSRKIKRIYNGFPNTWKKKIIKKDFSLKTLNLMCVTRLPIDEDTLLIKGIDRTFEIYKKCKKYKKYFIAGTLAGAYDKFMLENFSDIEFQQNLDRDFLGDLLSRGHVTIHTSRCESFGLTLTESMYLGNIVVTYPFGVVNEVIKNGKNGFIVNSVTEAIRTLNYINNNRNILPKISNNARETVINNFSTDKIGGEYLDLFKKIINKKNI